MIEKRAGKQASKKTQDGKTILYGYAAVFDSYSQDMGGWKEVIRSGTFAKSLKENDIRSLGNHLSWQILGRTGINLTLKEDSIGLYYEVELPETTYANDISIAVGMGLISQSSFGFLLRPNGEGRNWIYKPHPTDHHLDEWIRELTDVNLVEVSPVSIPAYTDTSVAKREFDQQLQSRSLQQNELQLRERLNKCLARSKR